MIRLWWEQAEGHTLKTRLMCRNITVTALSASTLTFSTAPGAQANTSAKVCPGPVLERMLRFPPDILLHDEGAARQHETHLLHRLPGAEQAGTFGKGVDPRPKAEEHSGKLLVGNTGEKAPPYGAPEKFFHKSPLSLKIQPTC